MDSPEVQQSFFKHIRSLMPANISFPEEIAELLNISSDSAYRRIRGEKFLTFDEIQILCSHYSVSVDEVMNIGSDSILFIGKNLESGKFSFENYLNELLTDFERIKTAKQKAILFEAKDIPIFHYFLFNELSAFKFFFWMRTVLAYPGYNNMKFEDNKLEDTLNKIGIEILKRYNELPSVEIWGVDSVNATLQQVEYSVYSGMFRKKESIDLLYQQFEKLIDHIKEQAACGEKFLPGINPLKEDDNFRFYFNEVFIGHNTILVETDGILTAYLNHGVLNYMHTRNTRFCEYTKKVIENTMSKSALISSASEKERNRFFNILQDKIEHSRKEALK